MYLFRINLQLFTGEKTEKATPKRKKEAREKGQVLQSKEINSAFILLFAFLTLRVAGSFMNENILSFTNITLSEINNREHLFTVNGVSDMLVSVILVTGKVVLPIVGITFLVGLICSYAQVGFLFTTKSLSVNLNRINPIEGFKKIFSKKSLVEFVKSLIKIGVVGYITFSYVLGQSENFINLLDMELSQIVYYLFQTTVNVAIRAAVVLIILAILDYVYQSWEYENELKMSKQEIKEEYKQMEGDPIIRSKIKEKQRQMSMRRMMQDIPKADVIITNPTHYAIAIRYDSASESAPCVLAKGKDIIAQNIRKVAVEYDIPIVENKPLARAVFYSVEIGAYIPPDLYQAVAEVLAYVYKLKNIV